MSGLLQRYFVANSAPVLLVKRHTRLLTGGYVPYRIGNARGFYWGRWHVSWRMPYSKVWAFDGRHWVPAYTLTDTQP